MTALTETDTYGHMRKGSADDGGLNIGGYAGGSVVYGLFLNSAITTAATTDTSSSLGAVVVNAGKKGTTSVGNLGDTENVFVVRNNTPAIFLLKGNGTLHITNTTLAALDEEDDIGLVRAFQKASSKGMGVVMSKWDEVMKENEEDLRRVGVLSSESDFVIQQNFNSLIGGSVWQLYTKLQDTKEFYQDKIAALEARLMRLEN